MFVVLEVAMFSKITKVGTEKVTHLKGGHQENPIKEHLRSCFSAIIVHLGSSKLLKFSTGLGILISTRICLKLLF